MNLTQAKNTLATMRSRTRLYETLVSECEKGSFDYDLSRGFAANAAAASRQGKFGVAELINFAETIEGGL